MTRRVYTRTGDDGTTGLLYGGRVGKDTPGPDTYGAVDEAGSVLGLARAEAERGGELEEILLRLQRELFVVGAELATAPENRHRLRPGIELVTAEMVAALEPVINQITELYEPPSEFVLPGENRIAAAHAGWLPDSQVIPYLNRLADLVYTLARWQEGTFRPVRVRP